jgi:tRNA(Ile)-lysidine synthase
MIRGAEAERDESFSREFCESIGVEFLSFRRDVPTYAKENALGIEEAARNVRYSIFADLLRGRNDLSCVAVAHNATDNLETVVFNMMRGAGTRGIAGIAPMRDDIIRPLLCVPKRDILRALNVAGVPFVTDTTNLETDYKRNYISAEILPKLSYLSENPEAAATKLSRALREDAEYLDGEAQSLFEIYEGTCVPRSDLSAMPSAIFYRFVSLMAKRAGCCVENTHIRAIKKLIFDADGDFSISLPGKMDFVCVENLCTISKKTPKFEIKYEYNLSIGVNHIEEIDTEIILSEEPINDFSSKVYKISIQQSIDFDIINGGLSVREKRDGDSYSYGGMTHKLKKLFCDKKISPREREQIPIFCDGDGIIWVPGFSVRSSEKPKSQKKLYIAIAKRA